MIPDYLGLGKTRKEPKSNYNTNFLDMGSDIVGFNRFGNQTRKDLNSARKSIKKDIRETKKSVRQIRREAKEFRRDVGSGGWIGSYIRKKMKNRK